MAWLISKELRIL